MFCARPGTSFPPRVIRMAPARTSAITIHIVTIVSLMLGENTIESLGRVWADHRVRRREMQRALDEADRERAGLAGHASLRERREQR